jgi:hypothetical protein
LAERAVYPTTNRYSLEVRLFVDFSQEKVAGEPPWDLVLKTNGFLPHDDVTGEASPRLGAPPDRHYSQIANNRFADRPVAAGTPGR